MLEQAHVIFGFLGLALQLAVLAVILCSVGYWLRNYLNARAVSRQFARKNEIAAKVATSKARRALA
jgi:hypothetical protein